MTLQSGLIKWIARLGGPATVLAVALLALGVVALGVAVPPAQGAEQDKGKDAPEKAKPQPAKVKLGLVINDPKACKGYTLLAPTNSTNSYLIDMEGRVVNSWKSDCNPGASAYLLENGNLLRTGAVRNPPFFGGGAGGKIQEFTWDGKPIWDYPCSDPTHLQHHDVCRLPNGNVLINMWVKKSAKEAVAAGRRPETVGDSYLLSDSLIEVQPTGKTTGKIVWEWHVWDHLVQEFDAMKANHGVVGDHPELIDVNFGEGAIAAMVAKPDELEKLRAIGYIGAAGRKPGPVRADWMHSNGLAYNPELDQIMLSVHEFSEFWIIDHSTKTVEAAGHKGGRYGKGGDLLYRWGNPRAYRAGAVKDQKFFGQHNAQWIAKGSPGEGHVLVFNNGMRRTGGAYSTVDEVALPVDAKGRYERTPGKAFGPDKAVWSYVAPKRTDFYAPFISGAQRLPNGNTLICSGTNGTIFEVTPKKAIVWKYVNPEKANSLIGGIPVVTLPVPGQPLGKSDQDRLKLTPAQKKQLADLQKEIDADLAKILTEAQRKQLKQFQDMAKGFGGGGPPGGFGGPPGGAGVFRAPRYSPDFAGLAGKELKPGKTIEEIQQKDAPEKPKDK